MYHELQNLSGMAPDASSYLTRPRELIVIPSNPAPQCIITTLVITSEALVRV